MRALKNAMKNVVKNSSPERDGELALEFLSRVSLFEELRSNGPALRALFAVMEQRRFAPGEAILSEGEPGFEMFFLTRGEASVLKKTTEEEFYRVAILNANNYSFFGEGGLLDSDTRSATILAETNCECLALSKEQFKIFSDAHSQWAISIIFKIANTVMQRLRKSNEDLILIYNALVAEIRGH